MCIYLLRASDYPGVTADNLVRDLFLTDPASDLGDILRQKGKRIPESCEWLPRQDEFQRWIVDDDKLHVLWLLGAPGIGKTMISSYIVEVLQIHAKQSPSAIFIFYFCNDRNDNRRTTPVIVRGLLVQLLQERPGLFQAIEDDYKRHRKSIADNLTALIAALRRMLRRTKARVYILIDALDECEGPSRHDFFAFIEDLDPDIKVSIIITSRPEVDVEDAVGDTTDIIRVDSAKVNDDLSKFINIRVDNLAKKKQRFPAKLIEDIRNVLLQQAGGTFLWVSLVLEDIASATTAKRAREKLERLPKGLSGVYRRILENIREDDVDDAAFILRWVVASRTPMKIRELAMVQALENEASESDVVPSQETLDELVDGYRVCGPLLLHDPESDTVNLVHQSAKDFLTAPECPERYRVDREEAQMSIWNECFKYMTLPEIREEWSTFRVLHRFTARYFPEVWKSTHFFLGYAVDELLNMPFVHIRSSLAVEFLSRYRHLERLPRLLRDYWLVSWSGVRVLAEGKDPQIDSCRPLDSMGNAPLEACRILLETGADVTAKIDGAHTSTTALNEAVGADNAELVLLLLAKGASVDEGDIGGWFTPLVKAAQQGNEQIAAILVKRGADIHKMGKWYMPGEWPTDNEVSISRGSPLLMAAMSGHCAVARVLLDNGADVSQEGEPCEITPLAAAVESGHVLMAKLLTSYGADLTWKHRKTQKSLFHFAMEGRHTEMVRFVSEKLKGEGINLEASIQIGGLKGDTLPLNKRVIKNALSRHPAGWGIPNLFSGFMRWKRLTALQLASMPYESNHKMVKLLLELGADVNAKSSRGLTALHTAAEFPANEAVLSCLIRSGADISARDHQGLTALHQASERGCPGNLVKLIEEGAEVDAKDSFGWTALHHAVNARNKESVDVLLRRGRADVNARSRDGETPIHIVSRPSRQRRAKAASPRGFQDWNGQLYTSRTERRETWPNDREVALLLLHHGASIDVADDRGYTPLHSSARSGNEMMAAFYLQRYSDVVGTEDEAARTMVTARCNQGTTPLFGAALGGHEDTCLLLIRWGADAFSMAGPQVAVHRYLKADQLRGAIGSYLATVKRFCVTGNIEDRAPDESGSGGEDEKAEAEHYWSQHYWSHDYWSHENDNTPNYPEPRAFSRVTSQLLDLFFGLAAFLEPLEIQLPRMVYKGYHTPVSMLLSAGGGRGLKDDDRSRAIRLAAQYGHAEVVKTLLEGVGSRELKEAQFYCALQIAVGCRREVVVRVLVNAGADVNYAPAWKTYILRHTLERTNFLQHVLHLEEPLDHRVRHGVPLITVASAVGDVGTVKLLLEHGANPNVGSEDTLKSPLACAILNGCNEVAHLLQCYFVFSVRP